jgi:hypothetical protein
VYTLFFMPHCEQFLYEAVLAASIRHGGLAHTAILGNSFAEYEERAALLRSTSTRDGDASCLSQLQPYIKGSPRTLNHSMALQCAPLTAHAAAEFPVLCGRDFPVSAFNSLSLHALAVSNANAFMEEDAKKQVSDDT